MEHMPVETVDVVVIGGGQAGLAIGYYLARRGLPSSSSRRIHESATAGVNAGTAAPVHVRPATTLCPDCPSRRCRTRSPPRTRWPTTSNNMRRLSICRYEPEFTSTPCSLRPGAVLVVGACNSGTERARVRDADGGNRDAHSPRRRLADAAVRKEWTNPGSASRRNK